MKNNLVFVVTPLKIMSYECPFSIFIQYVCSVYVYGVVCLPKKKTHFVDFFYYLFSFLFYFSFSQFFFLCVVVPLLHPSSATRDLQITTTTSLHSSSFYFIFSFVLLLQHMYTEPYISHSYVCPYIIITKHKQWKIDIFSTIHTITTRIDGFVVVVVMYVPPPHIASCVYARKHIYHIRLLFKSFCIIANNILLHSTLIHFKTFV